MDKLKIELQKIVTHVESLPPNPSDEQLQKKVCQIAVSLKRYGEYKDIIESAFSSCGFDSKRLKVTDSSHLTLQSLIAVLHQIEVEIESNSPSITPAENELNSLSSACDKLWELDTNRLCPETDYAINLQCGKGAFHRGDFASEPLFSYVHDNAFDQPTYKLFIKLLDNYEAQLGKSEVVTPEELKEQDEFMNSVFDTNVMKYVHQYLLQKNKTSNSGRKQFVNELKDLWFSLYSRRSKNDSSGFEHVFLGEVKDGEVTGMHNWCHIYMEEKRGNFNYKGFIKPRKRDNAPSQLPDEHDQLITMQFEWKGASKLVSSSFIGTSPEFEIALYTLLFYCGEEINRVEVGDYNVKVTCYKWKRGSKTYIATTFPSCD